MTKKKRTFLKLTDMSAPPRSVLSLSVMISRSVGGLSGPLEFFGGNKKTLSQVNAFNQRKIMS